MARPTALLSLVAALLSAPARVRAAPLDDPGRLVVGAELDLLPVVLSAIDGETGGSLQLWAGKGRNRLRLVTAVIHFPDALTDEPFRERDLTAMALIYDRFFRNGFRGPWVGGGVEVWWTEVGTSAGALRNEGVNPVATAGAGWVFRIWRGLYLNPWAAGHLVLGDRTIDVGGLRYGMRALEGEVSLKVGWAYAP